MTKKKTLAEIAAEKKSAKPAEKKSAKKSAKAKNTPGEQDKKKSTAPDKNLGEYTEKDGKFFHKDGREVTHKGTINLLKNKKDWKPGQSGNPEGKPKGAKNRATVLAGLMKLTVRKADGGFVKNSLNPDEKKMDFETAIAAALIKKALSGNVSAIQEIQNTLYGKITDKAQISITPTIIRDDIPDGS